MKFEFIHTRNKVIALARSDGKVVRGTAACSPNDTFDVEVGERLASARCKVKVLGKQAKTAAETYADWRDIVTELKTVEAKAKEHSWNASVEYDKAVAKYEQLLNEIK